MRELRCAWCGFATADAVDMAAHMIDTGHALSAETQQELKAPGGVAELAEQLQRMQTGNFPPGEEPTPVAPEDLPPRVREALAKLKSLDPLGKAKVVSREQAEEAGWVVCAPVGGQDPAMVPGSTQTNCVDCGTLVWVSPSAPTTPPRICMACMAKRLEQEEEDPVFQVGEGSLAEYAAWMEKQMGKKPH